MKQKIFKSSQLILFASAGLLISLSATAEIDDNQLSAQPISTNIGANGKPFLVKGQLIEAKSANKEALLVEAMNISSAYQLNNNETFEINREWTDSQGQTHVRFDQSINGLKVYGTNVMMHIDTNNYVNMISGEIATADDSGFSYKNAIKTTEIENLAEFIGKIIDKPEIAYVYLPETAETKLSWKTQVEYTDFQDNFQSDIVFYDIYSGEELTRHPQVHYADSRTTYHFNNVSESNLNYNGRLLCTQSNNNCNDAVAQRAHDGAGLAYNYFQTKFNRDSLDNNGFTVYSNVHVGNGYNNASWHPQTKRLYYGDGSGQFNDWTRARDIIGHEFTHGVTTHEGNMTYANQSGALNEAISDILGVSMVAHVDGLQVPNWKLSEGLRTNGQPLRYMDNPTQDGQSTDYYPERNYPNNCSPTAQNDRCGVHTNSGIANLAYVLLVQGGQHPRNKTSVVVPAIGLAKAEQIFYRALTTYWSASTNFASGRVGTEQAASDLYGEAEKIAVGKAWCAVGVGSCPTGGGPIDPPPPPPNNGNQLTNNVAKTGLSGGPGNQLFYTFVVPA